MEQPTRINSKHENCTVEHPYFRNALRSFRFMWHTMQAMMLKKNVTTTTNPAPDIGFAHQHRRK